MNIFASAKEAKAAAEFERKEHKRLYGIQEQHAKTARVNHRLADELRKMLAPEGSGQLAVSVSVETMRQIIEELEKANG